MLAVGDIHIHVRDFETALRFWVQGLQLDIAQHESGAHGAFARLDFPSGGPSLMLISPPELEEDEPLPGNVLSLGFTFDITTSDFDNTLVRMLEHGGQQISETETYNELRLTTIADPEGNTFELIEVPADAG